MRRICVDPNMDALNLQRKPGRVILLYMVDTSKWFERKFTLDLPLRLYPNVVERLRGIPPRLEDHLLKLPREVLTKKTATEWSMQEHAGHLLDLESLQMERLNDYEQKLSTLTAADLENKKTYQANHNDRSIQVLLEDFRRERLAFVRRLENYDEEFIQRSAIHPRLQIPMRVIDLAFFTAEHDDHHLTRISTLIKKSLEL